MSKHTVMWKGTEEIVCEVEVPGMPDDDSIVYLEKNETNLAVFKSITDTAVSGISLVQANVFEDAGEETIKKFEKATFSRYGEGPHLSVHADTVTTQNPRGDRG